jgi:GNAT superfamily N-acetyltransferase
VKEIQWPDGITIEQLNKRHKRTTFCSGVTMVDEWLKKRARQSQEKQLSVTRVLLKAPNIIAGFYTLALGQVNFDKLPHKMARKLPRTLLPIVTLAWLAVDKNHQGKRFGERLLAQALADCYNTGQIMPFVAVLLDCATVNAKTFYQHYDFEELPGHPMKLMLPWKLLTCMMEKIER